LAISRSIELKMLGELLQRVPASELDLHPGGLRLAIRKIPKSERAVPIKIFGSVDEWILF
jgi:hypothetical protein